MTLGCSPIVSHKYSIYPTPNAKKHIAISRKQRILGVDGVEDVEEYNQYEELEVFKELEKMIKKVEGSIDKSENPWVCKDCEGRFVKG